MRHFGVKFPTLWPGKNVSGLHTKMVVLKIWQQMSFLLWNKSNDGAKYDLRPCRNPTTRKHAKSWHVSINENTKKKRNGSQSVSNTRNQERRNEGKKPNEVHQKCLTSRLFMLHFWFQVQQRQMIKDSKWADFLGGLGKTVDQCPLFYVFVHGSFSAVVERP